MDYNAIMAELAEYTRIAEQAAATVDALKDALKQYMTENGLDTLTGAEHKATFKVVTSSRIDTTALKQAAPEIVAQYTRTTETRRFTFV